MAPLYMPVERLRENDRAAAGATTQGYVDDITNQWQRAQEPPRPEYGLPGLGSLGVSDAPSPIMSAIGAVGQVGQRAQQAASDAFSWALPSLDALGVTKAGSSTTVSRRAVGEDTVIEPPDVPEDGTMASRGGSSGYAPSTRTPQSSEGVEQHAALISEAARHYGVPEAYVKGLMEIESGGNPAARSVQGAMGLMQVMPFHFGQGEDGMDPRTNVFKGVKILADNYRRYGDWDKAAAAYFGAIDDQGNITGATDATGTDGYKYVRLWRSAAGKYGGDASPTSSAPAAASPPSAPAPAASAPAPQAAGAPQDTVTIQHIDDGRKLVIQRANLDGYMRPPAPGVPVMWRVVDDRQSFSAPALSLSALDEARAGNGGGEMNAMMLRGPLSQQPELPADEPYDPRIYDEGPHEGGREGWGSGNGSDGSASNPNDPNRSQNTIPGVDGNSAATAASAPPPVTAGTTAGYPDIPGPDLGPGGFPIVDQPSRYPNVQIVQGGPPPDDGSGQTVEFPPATQTTITQGGPPPDDGSGQVIETQMRPRQQPEPATAQQDEPLYLDQSMPAPPGWSALVNAAGQVKKWVQDRAQEAGQALSRPPSAEPNQIDRYVPSYAPQAAATTAAQAPSRSPMETVVNPIVDAATAATSPGGLLEPMGGMIRVGERMADIRAQAARELGLDPNTPVSGLRAVRDERWRAANPELATEYDQLEQQFGLTVVGQAGDASRFGRGAKKTVEVIAEELDAAKQAVRAARESGDIAAERAASDEMWGLTDQLVDAQNARRSLEPAIASDVGRRVEDVRVYDEAAQEQRISAGRYPNEVVKPADQADLSGPVSIPTSDPGSRLNMAIGPQPGPSRRMYHGTGSNFDRPDPSKFDQNGSFGPGYYLTDTPEVAGRYADLRAGEGATGQNIRAVDVPENARMLDMEAPLTPGLIDRVEALIGRVRGEWPDVANELDVAVQTARERLASGDTMYRPSAGSFVTDVLNAADRVDAQTMGQFGGRGLATEILARSGFDGLTYNAGARVPILGRDGKPLEYGGAMIFPDALGTLRNAFSGEIGGARIGPSAPTSTGPLAQATADLGNAVFGGVAGATVGQAADPYADDETRLRNAAIGFGAGALGFPVAGRMMRPGSGGARMAIGPQGPGQPPAVTINGRVVRASSSKPPNLLEIAQAYRHSVGMLGQLGTGLMNAMGGPVSAGSGLATDVIRQGLLKGYPAPAIAEAGSLVAGLGEAARDALGTALGFVPQRVRNAPDFRPPLGERMPGAIGKVAGYAIDTPGRLATQVPDAFFGTLFNRMGRRRAANELMMESGVSRLDIPGQFAEVQRLLNNPTPDEARRIDQMAKEFSDELTYKGPEGYWEKVLSGPFRAPGGPTTANSPVAHQIHDLVGSFLMPFYSSIFKIHKLAATHTPGLGMIADTSKPMSERIARQAVGLGFGLWVADRAAQNLVTGPGPDDLDEQARLKASGWDSWSTYLPGVGYVKSDNLAHAAPFLKTIGAYYDSQRYPSKKPTQGDDLEAGEAVAKQIMRAFEGFPVLKTFSDLYKAAQKPVEGGADMLINAGSSFVPAIVRANESSKDPYQRTVDPNAPLAERIEQRALNRVGSIPGVGNRQDSPPALDRKGEPVPNPRFGLNPFLPVPNKQPKEEDPLTAEMGRYGVDLDKARDRFAFTRAGADSPDGAPGSVRVMLKPEWQQEWARARWQKVQEGAATAQADPRYAQAAEGVRRRVWENVLAAAEQYADRVVKGAHRAEIEEMIRQAPVSDPLPQRRAS